MTVDFESLKAIVDASGMSEEAKRFVKASLWTQGEIPEISSAEQYETYAKLSDQLATALPPRDAPEFAEAFTRWAQSPNGVLSSSYGARMVEWEERREPGGHRPQR